MLPSAKKLPEASPRKENGGNTIETKISPLLNKPQCAEYRGRYRRFIGDRAQQVQRRVFPLATAEHLLTRVSQLLLTLVVFAVTRLPDYYKGAAAIRVSQLLLWHYFAFH